MAGNVTVRTRPGGRGRPPGLTSRWDSPPELEPTGRFSVIFLLMVLISVPWRLRWSNNGAFHTVTTITHDIREGITQVSLMILSMSMVKLET